MSAKKIVVCLAALASLIGCNQQPVDSMHEVRAQCGRDARAWAALFLPELRQEKSSSGMSSHYSEHDHRCYAELWVNTGYESSGDVFFMSYLVDVDDNRGIGELRQMLKAQTAPTILVCSVAGRSCASGDEWNKLAKPYIHP